MKTLKFYKTTAWALLLLNIVLIAFFFMTKPKHPPRDGKHFRNKAAKIMDLDAEQEKQFFELASSHNKQMEAIRAKQNDLLKPYFQSLIDTLNSENKQTYLYQLKQLEQDKIEITYKHFEEVKTMLRPNQQASFKTFMERALRNILMEQIKPAHPQKH